MFENNVFKLDIIGHGAYFASTVVCCPPSGIGSLVVEIVRSGIRLATQH